MRFLPVRRRLAVLLAPVLMAAGIAAVTGVAPHLPAAAARADVVTASQNDLRDGWDPAEPGLAPASDGGPVGGPTFGQLFATHLNGQVYAQPVVAGQTVIVATETNYVYGLNAVTGAIEWTDDLGPPLPATTQHCTDMTPDIGITGTPVYDPATGTIYLVAVVNDGPTPYQPHVYAYALSAQTGLVEPGWPVTIKGAPVNDPSITFNPVGERQRAGLLLMNGWIYVAFASYCDYQPYVGYVAGVNTSSRASTLWTDEASLAGSMGGIWQGGSGLMSDGPGRIFVTSGTGVGPPPGPGTSAPATLGDSVVRLSVGSDGSLSAAGFFSPANAPALDAGNIDFGAGGPVGLPFGTSSYPDLLVQAGKDGRVFLLNRDNLGGREQGPGGTDNPVAEAGPYQGQWGHPAVFGPASSIPAGTASSGDYIYYIGKNDVMRYLEAGADGTGTPTITDVADSSNTFGYLSGSPVVTSDGDDPASAVVWAVDLPGKGGTGSAIDAYPAVPPDGCTSPCTISPIWSAPIGTGAAFTIPATNDGRVYVGSADGVLYGFGSPDTAPLTGSPANFGQVAAGGTGATQAMTLTAAAAVTVTGASAVGTGSGTSPFSAGAPSVNGTPASWPVSLNQGDQLTVPVTFEPASPVGYTGRLDLATSATNFPTVSVSLTGTGTAPGFYAAPSSYSFGTVPDGTSQPATITITNSSTGTETIASRTGPPTPFSATLPAAGTTLAAGQSVSVPVKFAPKLAGARTGSFTIADTSGDSITVKLSGTGARAVSKLTPAPAAVKFGNVQLGHRATTTITIDNKGNLPATITGTGAPLVPFGSQAQVTAGLPVNPGENVKVPVTFTPTTTGPASSEFTLRWHDALGDHHVNVTLTGSGVAPATGSAVTGPGGGWQLNGGAAMSGQALQLASGTDRTTSAVYGMPQATSGGLTASFTATLRGQSGMTIGLLGASTASPATTGAGGRELGFGGLNGVAVVLDAGDFPGGKPGSFAGIATGSAGGKLVFAATTTSVPNLHYGSHAIGVTVSGSQVNVTVDGQAVLSATLPPGTLPASVLPAFTGATGSSGGTVTVSQAGIAAGSVQVPSPGAGWSYNGAAQLTGSATTLTRAVKNAVGTVVDPQPVPTAGLTVTFTASLSGGSGANAVGLALLNPASSSATSLGQDAAEVGLGGLTGTGVLLTTLQKGGCAFIDAAMLCSAAGGSTLTRLASAQAIPALRDGPLTVTVQVTQASGSYLVTAWVDGELVFQKPAPGLTATSLLAFTGSTGTETDTHLVRDVAISTAGT